MSDDATLRAEWRSPHHSRLLPANPDRIEILERHARAIARGLPTYADPLSGFSVFTADYLANRGYCCDSGCRHCPFLV